MTRLYGDQSGRWTHRLIPELATWLDRKHVQVDFYLAQALLSHGCFNAYLKCFKKRDDELCRYCESLVENAEHILFVSLILQSWLLFGGGIFLFLPWLVRLVGLPNGRVAADGSLGQMGDGRVIRDFKLKPTGREL